MLTYKKIVLQSLCTTLWKEGRENFVLNGFLFRAFILSLNMQLCNQQRITFQEAWSSESVTQPLRHCKAI